MVNVLEEALEVVKQRGEDYGDAADMYRQIADLWSVWTGANITPQDVAHMLIQMKQVRDRIAGGHRDSKVDICGYAWVLEQIDKTP